MSRTVVIIAAKEYDQWIQLHLLSNLTEDEKTTIVKRMQSTVELIF